MTSKIEQFAKFHRAGNPLVLVNVWDAGSARTVANAGAKAIATGSWSVAAALGLEDGEAVPLDLALANLARIVAAVDLPVSIDLETGYGDPAATLAAAEAAGAIGCNIEDGLIGGGLRDAAEQAGRIAAARNAVGQGFFINARTDLFLASPTDHHAGLVDQALDRGAAYAKAGADGLFVPGLIDETLIARVARASDLPVNVMATPGAPETARLATLGVARISHGPGPWRRAMATLADFTRAQMR